MSIHIYAPGKFSPPQLTDETLIRESLIRDIDTGFESAPSTMFIQAPPGFGKSTLARQYISENKLPFLWFNISEEDNDPVEFILNFYSGMKRKNKNLNSDILEKFLIDGSTIEPEKARVFSMELIEEIKDLDKDFAVVFDDLHKLDSDSFASFFLAELTKLNQSNIARIFITREITDALEGLKSACTVNVYQKDLIFGEKEIHKYFYDTKGKALSTSSVSNIYKFTGGWVSGVVSAGEHFRLSGKLPGPEIKKDFSDYEDSSVENYFIDNVFPNLPDGLPEKLSRISFLERIPVDLAVLLCSDSGVEAALDGLIERNLFVGYIVDEKKMVRFHDLFREALNILAIKTIEREERLKLIMEAAEWHIKHGYSIDSLKLYISAQAWNEADMILKDSGVELHALNRLTLLERYLDSIPSEIRDSKGWMAYFSGVNSMSSDPVKALLYLSKASELFAGKDAEGELLSLSHLLYFYLTGAGLFSLGEMMYPRTEELSIKLKNDLPPKFMAYAFCALSIGACVLHGDRDKSGVYYELAENYARESKNINVKSISMVLNCYRSIILGSLDEAGLKQEKIRKILNSPALTINTSMMIIMSIINMSVLENDISVYRLYRGLIEDKCQNISRLKESIFPNLIKWDVEVAIYRGDLIKAKELLSEGFSYGMTSRSPHLKSLFLGHQALIHSIEGRKERALESLKESLENRSMAGGQAFMAQCSMVAGAVYTRLGMHEDALVYLNNLIESGDQTINDLVRVASLAYRTKIFFAKNRDKEALNDLETMLKIMESSGINIFYTATPELMRSLLQTAVKNKIYEGFVRKLATDHYDIGITAKGEAVPLIDITAFGRFHVRMGGKEVLSSTNFSPLQQEILGAILTSSNLTISINELLLRIWPDKDESKARSSLDNQISAIRRTIAKVIPDSKTGHYLVTEKKQLRLENCRADIHDLRVLFDESEYLLKNKKDQILKRENIYRKGFLLLKGEYLESFSIDDKTSDFKIYILPPMISAAAESWMKIINEYGAASPDDMIVIKNAVLEHCDSFQLIRDIYNYLLEKNKESEAVEFINTYNKRNPGEEVDIFCKN